MKKINALTYYEQFKEQFPNYTGYPNRYELETIDKFLQLNSEFRTTDNDVLSLLNSAFSYKRDWNIIFSEENLNRAISEMINYLNSTFLPAQANWVDEFEEHHTKRIELYFDPRNSVLCFKEVDTSYWAQYSNRIDLLTPGFGKLDLMNFLIRTNGDIHQMKDYLKYRVYHSYSGTPEPPESRSIFFSKTERQNVLSMIDSKHYCTDFVVMIDTDILSGDGIQSDYTMTQYIAVAHFSTEKEANEFASRFGYSDMSRHFVSGLLSNATTYKKCYSFENADKYIKAKIKNTIHNLDYIYKFYFFRLLEHHTQCSREAKSLIEYAFNNLQLFSIDEKKHISKELTRLIDQTYKYIENRKGYTERYWDFKHDLIHEFSSMLSNF